MQPDKSIAAGQVHIVKITMLVQCNGHSEGYRRQWKPY